MRPTSSPVLTVLLALIETLSLGGLIFVVITFWKFWPEVPEQTAVHFGFDGKPDRWGSKHTLFLVPGLSLVLYISFTLGLFVEQSPIFLLSFLKLELIWLIAWGEWKTFRVALGQAEGVGALFVPTVLILTFATTILFIIVTAVQSR